MGLPLISDDDIQKVREATDIVQLVSERVTLRQKGREFWGCCPLHNEKTPSFKVDPESGFWHCFGCDEGGDIFGFVMKLDNLSFPDAVKKLAEKSGIEISDTSQNAKQRGYKSRLKDVCAASQEYFHRCLKRMRSSELDEARQYLSSRGLGGSVPSKWNLGYAPKGTSLPAHLAAQGFSFKEMIDANVAVLGKNNVLRNRFFGRAMFPIHDISGDCIAFGGRVIGEGSPKYLNSQDTPIFHKSNVLYGLDKAKGTMASSGCAIVTEGYTDVIAMHESGFTNTVATLGTALTSSHIKTLSRHARRKIIYLFDGDVAGQRATERALQFIDETITPESGGNKLDICALSLPNGADPAEFLGANGSSAMEKLLDSAKPLILYGIERRLERHDKSSAEDRARALDDALDVLAPIKSSILAKDYAAQIADMLGYRVEDVTSRLASLPAKTRASSFSANENMGNQKRRPARNARYTSSLKNRLQLERELLAICCQDPVDMLSNAEEIQSICWTDSINAQIADVMFSELMTNLNTSPCDLLRICGNKVEGAEKILTGSVMDGKQSLSDTMRYVIDELVISDCENEIAALKTSLSQAKSDGSNNLESDPVFEKMVSLQSKLSTMKKRHSLAV